MDGRGPLGPIEEDMVWGIQGGRSSHLQPSERYGPLVSPTPPCYGSASGSGQSHRSASLAAAGRGASPPRCHTAGGVIPV